MNQGTQKKNFTSMSTIILVDKVYLILFEMCHAWAHTTKKNIDNSHHVCFVRVAVSVCIPPVEAVGPAGVTADG